MYYRILKHDTMILFPQMYHILLYDWYLEQLYGEIVDHQISSKTDSIQLMMPMMLDS